MKKWVRIWMMALMLMLVVLPLTSAEVKADTGTCKITVEYDASLATLSMYDNKTNAAVSNGSTLTINENGWTNQIVIQFKIADYYRIKSVTINNEDNTADFVEGAYGGMGKAFNSDTIIKLTVEKTPASLPYVAGARIYAGRTKQNATLVGDSYTVDQDTFKLWAYPNFTDGGTYPEYYARGNWQFSLDGTSWYNCNDYGWSNRTDFWPGWKYWPEKTPINFLTANNYYLRIQLNGRQYYSQGLAYSDAIFMNSDGTVNRINIKNPTVLPSASASSSGGNDAGQSVSTSASVSETVTNEVVDLPVVRILKPQAAKKAVIVKWKKVSSKAIKKIGGIEIQYSLDKTFTNGVKRKTAKKSVLSKKITKLKSKKKYYVRVRAYKMVKGVKHVSKWSKVKSVKIK